MDGSGTAGQTVVVALHGSLAGGRSAQVQALVLAAVDPARLTRIVCEPRGPVDLGLVDALARLQLLARRLRVPLQLRGGADQVARLLALTGLPAVPLEPVGQAEAGEQGGVEEVVHVGDLPA